MSEASHVASCISSMVEAVSIPVSVKCRIGIDDLDDFAFLDKFVSLVAEAGCRKFVIHARKAWLSGLSPKQNREVPPLDYERVAAIKERYPQLEIILNGGINLTSQISENIDEFDGFMIGREAYSNPYFLHEIERNILKNTGQLLSRDEVVLAMIPYARAQREHYGTPVKSITRHILGLYHGELGAKAWKRVLSTLPYEADAAEHVILSALDAKNEAAARQKAA